MVGGDSEAGMEQNGLQIESERKVARELDGPAVQYGKPR